MSLDALFWAPHAVLHRKLQDGNISKAALDEHFDWLLAGTQKFRPQSESSRKQIAEKLKVEIRCKAFAWDVKHRPLALRAARLLDLDEVQAMLLLKRWLKENEPDLKPEDLPENDPMAINELLLQVLRYYHQERILLLKCIQVVMLKAGESDEAGRLLADLLSRLVRSNLEEQLHARLRENLEGGAAAITARLKACDARPPASAPSAAAAPGSSAGPLAAPAVTGGSAANLEWLSRAHSEMRSQLATERLELLHCLMLMYEVCGVRCKPERAQALARLLLDRVFASATGADSGNGGGGAAAGSGGGGGGGGSADPTTLLCQQLAGLLLLSCLDLPGHVQLATAPSAAAAGAADSALPMGGKTMDVHNQLSQYAASPSTSLLLLTWAGCLRLMDAATGSGGSGPGGHMIRDLDGAARELEARVLLLGRASHCVAALEHALLHNLPLDASDPTLLRDLADTLSLLAVLCHHEPALVQDLAQQSVPFASGTTRSWTDVVAGVLAIGPQLHARVASGAQQPQHGQQQQPSTLQLLADAAQLLGSVAAGAPGRVLALLPLLPLFSVPELLAGLPPLVPLDALPSFTVPSSIESFCGLLPYVSALQRDLEQPAGRYPLTVALLNLFSGLLERGFVASPLPAAVLYVLHELLPGHHHWRYASPKERWALTHAALRVLRVAVTAGACVTDPDISALSPLPPPPSSSSLLRAGAGAVVPYGPGLSAAAAAVEAAAASSLTPDQLLQAALPRLHVSVLSAALLKLLLLHGGVLLARSLPPPAEALEALRAEDASRAELPYMEECAGELLQLVPPLLAAACAHPQAVPHPFMSDARVCCAQEQPFEEFLLAGQEPTAAAHVASYVAYHEADQESTPPERQPAQGSDARACAALWDESSTSTAPLRALVAAAARLFPAVPSHLLQLLRLTAASPDTARAAYAFLQRSVSLVVLHGASEPAIRHLGGGEVELAAALPWNLAPSVPGLALPQGCVGALCPMPPLLSELRGRYMLVAWDAEVSGGGGQSRGQRQDLQAGDRGISYLALRALLSLAACVARPVARSLPAVSLCAAVPPGSAAEACLRALLRGDAASAHPHHHLLAAQLAADAVGSHAKLLDALMFPCALEEELFPRAPPAAAAPAPAAAGGGGAGGAGTLAVRRPLRPPRQALDGLYGTLQQAARLKREQPQVLCSALRLLAAMWRAPAAAHRAVTVLRASADLWPSLEACLLPVAPPAAAAAEQHAVSAEVASQRAWCEALALQVLTAEAFARSRAAAAAAGGGPAGSDGGGGGGLDALLDKLAREGLLLRLLRDSVGPAAAPPPAPGAGGVGAAAAAEAAAAAAEPVGALQRASAALYLEMGAEAVAELWGPPGEPDAVALAAGVRE
ncbi:hypothetical protein TSOC_012151, partial [Tetrabaena socialis]